MDGSIVFARSYQCDPIYYTQISIRTIPVLPLLGHFISTVGHVWAWTPSNTWFIGPTRVHIQNGISISSAVFVGLTIMTDHATLSVATGHGQLVLRCSLIIHRLLDNEFSASEQSITAASIHTILNVCCHRSTIY